MLDKTMLTNKIIVDIAKSIYGIDINKIERLNRGSANIYVLNNNQYVLKEFQSKYTKEEIDKEIIIINHLKKDNIPVPEYLKTKSGVYNYTYKNRVIIIQKYIDGHTIESNTGTKEQVMESAQYLGKIVKSLDTLKITLPYCDMSYTKKTLDESITNHQELLNKITENNYPQIYKDLTDKISMLKYIKDNIDLSNTDKITIMNTHGDYSVLQFIYKNDKINAIIDFVSACKMPVVWEVIRSYSYIDEKAKDGILEVNNLTQYVKCFANYVQLNNYDLKYMSYLYLIQLLTSTYGYKQYLRDNTKIDLLEFAYFRTKLCRYLFDNANQISNTLIENNCN